MTHLPTNDTEAHGLPLAGVRVLDLSRILAGPHAAGILADLGADVIKVERPGIGDETRRWGPPFHGPEAIYFHSVNRNRRSVALDLDLPDDRDRVIQLVAWADVVLENFLPGQLARFGLDSVRAAHPDTTWVSIRGASGHGPLAELPGLDAMVQGHAGIMSLTGTTGSGPFKAGVPMVDLVTGLYAAVAALAGILAQRGPRRRGPHIEVPLFECAVASLIPHAAQHLATGKTPTPSGNDHPTVVPYGMFSAADGQIMVGAASNGQFAALCSAVGVPSIAEDERFATNALRVTHRHTLIPLLAQAFAEVTRAELLPRLRAGGVPCAPVNDVASALAEDQIAATDLVQSIDTEHGPINLVATPYRVDGRRPRIRSAAPALGAHTEEIFGDAPLPLSTPQAAVPIGADGYPTSRRTG